MVRWKSGIYTFCTFNHRYLGLSHNLWQNHQNITMLRHVFCLWISLKQLGSLIFFETVLEVLNLESWDVLQGHGQREHFAPEPCLQDGMSSSIVCEMGSNSTERHHDVLFALAQLGFVVSGNFSTTLLQLGQRLLTRGLNKQMGVSWNGGTTKWMICKGKSDWNGWFRGTPILGNIQIIFIKRKLPVAASLRVTCSLHPGHFDSASVFDRTEDAEGFEVHFFWFLLIFLPWPSPSSPLACPSWMEFALCVCIDLMSIDLSLSDSDCWFVFFHVEKGKRFDEDL